MDDIKKRKKEKIFISKFFEDVLVMDKDEAIKQILKSLYVNLKMMDKAKALEAAE